MNTVSSQATASHEEIHSIPRWKNQLLAIKRLVLWHAFSGRLPLYLISEYPKSGGTWFGQMLADCLEVPFPRNNLAPALQASVLVGHHTYSRNFKNVVVVFRDGRDVMCSAYYHCLFPNEHNTAFGVREHRSHVAFSDYDNIRENLPKFIEYCFTKYTRKVSRFHWAQFVDSWIDTGTPIVKYEELLTQPVDVLSKISYDLTGRVIPRSKIESVVEKYSFRRVAGRNPGEQNLSSFARKGIAGDWKNHFSADACVVFNRYASNCQLLCSEFCFRRQFHPARFRL